MENKFLLQRLEDEIKRRNKKERNMGFKEFPRPLIIVIGGLIFGPLTSLVVTVIVSVVQMITISGTGVLGCIMNIISSCSFACTAAVIYKKKHKLQGAILGLFCGIGCQVAVMMLWNYLITPIYMGYPREAVVELLLPAFLPFNLIKAGLNAAITMILYKPVVTVLRRSNLIESDHNSEKNADEYWSFIDSSVNNGILCIVDTFL